MNPIFRLAFLSALLISVIPSVQADDLPQSSRLGDITIKEAKKTFPSVIISMSGLERGQEITPGILESARVAILSSSLFETVEFGLKKSNVMNSYDLTITVKEKWSWFIIPNFRYSSDGIGGGLAYGDSNFMGYAKKVLIAGNWSKDNRTAVLGYRDPSVLGSMMTLSLDAIYRWDTMKEYSHRMEVRKVRLKEMGFTLLPGIQWNPRFSTSIGGFYRLVKHRLLSQAGGARLLSADALRDGHDIAGVVQFDYKDTQNVNGLPSGSEISLETTISDNRFLSDFDYFRQSLRAMHGRSIWEHWLHYVGNGSAQFGSTLPFYRELQMGGTNLRGYRDRQFRGDTRYSFNHELIFHIYNFKRLILRGVTFWDSAVIYFKDRKFKRDNWRNGIGGGLRVYFKGIAIPLVGYDFGYGVDDNAFEHYLNIGVNF